MNKCNVTSISIRDEWTLRWAAVDLKFPIVNLVCQLIGYNTALSRQSDGFNSHTDRQSERLYYDTEFTFTFNRNVTLHYCDTKRNNTIDCILACYSEDCDMR